MRIDWDRIKNLQNQRKHGVSFEEASELFTSGSDYLEVFDESHSISEDRFICIGPIRRGLVLVVKTEPEEDILRIISARCATNREKRLYKDFMKGCQE